MSACMHSQQNAHIDGILYFACSCHKRSAFMIGDERHIPTITAHTSCMPVFHQRPRRPQLNLRLLPMTPPWPQQSTSGLERSSRWSCTRRLTSERDHAWAPNVGDLGLNSLALCTHLNKQACRRSHPHAWLLRGLTSAPALTLDLHACGGPECAVAAFF